MVALGHIARSPLLCHIARKAPRVYADSGDIRWVSLGVSLVAMHCDTLRFVLGWHCINCLVAISRWWAVVRSSERQTQGKARH